MAISDKLNYLIETKQLFKDRLNSLGAEIIESTTFRNYLNWLDTFYGESSDKTDLAKNGVVGKTSQDGDPTPDYPLEINNLSGDVEYKVRGKNLFDKDNKVYGKFYTATGEIGTDSGLFLQEIYIKVKPNSEYTFSSKNNDYFRMCEYDINKTFIQRQIASNNTANSITYTTTSTTEYIRVSCNNANLMTLQIEQGTTATPYEPYISESFPLSLKSRNLFDKNNFNVLNAYFTANSPTITSSYSDRTIYIPCKPNTTYTISKLSSPNARAIGYTSAIPTISASVDGALNINANGTTGTITTGENAKYLVMRTWNEGQDSGTSFQQILDSIQIEESSTATTYEPYYDIELCNISDYKDRIYSQNGEFYLEKKNGKAVFNGSENWVYYNTAQGSLFRNNAVDVSIGGISPISNHFIGVNGAGSRYDGTIYYNYNAIPAHTTFDILTNKFNNVEDFKTWLLTHNTEVQYAIATQTTTKITQENYPTLYSQLLAIQEFLTKYKINKEFLLDYSSPEIEY